MKIAYFYIALNLVFCMSCKARSTSDSIAASDVVAAPISNPVVTGDARTDIYYPMIAGKRIAIFGNHTALLPTGEHLVDHLLHDGHRVTAVFSPEHGFRGTADAGEHVSSSVDIQTGIPILSLYDGGNNRPSSTSMSKFDVLLVDIQDVGLRFYTYYITMCRLIQACADYGKQVIILDRPNPNGHIVDGPLLDMKYKSGVGWLPIPVLHGMTLGELAQMAVGEHWIGGKSQCQLQVVTCQYYTHSTLCDIQLPPSPNLPNLHAIYLYPSLCYFEATPVSVGRGTDYPFQVYGHPNMKGRTFSFVPESRSGAKTPPLQNKVCQGVDLRDLPDSVLVNKGIDLTYLIDAYQDLGMGDKFFTNFFEKLIGVSWVRQMIEQGATAEDIRARWQPDVEKFKEQRKKYLLYEE
ncbi:MAG: DUF1343 domain-containing protein [Bacteroidaceae bacterium]|nr:DUF1343 domain-containing protein [Bacteroidaceae bacterium]